MFASVACPLDVLSMSAASNGTAVVITTTDGHAALWRVEEPELRYADVPHAFRAVTAWFCGEQPRLLLCSEQVEDSLLTARSAVVPSSARSAVVHVRGLAVARWSNEIQSAIYTNARPDASGSRLLVATLGTGNVADICVLNVETDTSELVTDDHSTGGVVLAALSPQGDTCVVFRTRCERSFCEVFHRLSDNGWARSSSVRIHPTRQRALPTEWAESSAAHAAFSKCGSMVTFFSSALTSHPMLGTLTLSAAGEATGTAQLLDTGYEHLPRDVQFGESGAWVRTQRGVLLVGPTAVGEQKRRHVHLAVTRDYY